MLITVIVALGSDNPYKVSEKLRENIYGNLFGSDSSSSLSSLPSSSSSAIVHPDQGSASVWGFKWFLFIFFGFYQLLQERVFNNVHGNSICSHGAL